MREKWSGLESWASGARAAASSLLPELSRRQFLALSGIVGGGGPLAGVSPRLDVRDGRIRLVLGDRAAVIFDKKYFDADPRIESAENGRVSSASVRGATLPRLGLAWDLECELVRTFSTSRFRLKLPGLDFQAEVDAHAWLEGTAELAGSGSLPRIALELAGGGTWQLDGGAVLARWDREGSLVIKNGAAARLKRNRVLLETRRYLLKPGFEESPLKALAQTQIRMGRDRGAWSTAALIPPPPFGRISAGERPFERIELAVAKTRNGAAEDALLATASAHETGIYFRDPQIQPASLLTFAELRVARELRSPDDLVVVRGKFSDEERWVELDGAHFKLANGSTETDFRLQTKGADICEFGCEPELRASILPLAGATSLPTEAPPGTKLSFDLDGSASDTKLRSTIRARARKGGRRRGLCQPVRSTSPAANISVEQAVTVVRHEDLLVLRLKPVNASIQFPNGTISETGSGPPALEVWLPGQSFAEETSFESQDTAAKAFNGIKASWLAGPSKLVVKVSKAQLGGSLSLSSVLEMIEGGTLVVPAAAQQWKKPWLVPPLAMAFDPGDAHLRGLRRSAPKRFKSIRPTVSTVQDQLPTTELELPYRLLISPHDGARLRMSPNPMIVGSARELWTARFDFGLWQPYLTAVASREPNFDDKDLKLPWGIQDDSSLTGKTARSRIIAQTSQPTTPGFAPIVAEKLWLSNLGASFDLRAEFGLGAQLEQWLERGELGRDNFVRLAYGGWLLPFGHRATLIIETRREWRERKRAASTDMVAGLIQTNYIVVRDRVREYTPTGAFPFAWPFPRAEILTRRTPKLDPLKRDETTLLRWPKLSGQNFEFFVQTEDLDGKIEKFRMPMAFVGRLDISTNEKLNVGLALRASVGYRRDDRKYADLGNQVVTLAQEPPGVARAETALAIDTIGLDALHEPGNDRYPFYPSVDDFSAVSPSLGRYSKNKKAQWFRYWKNYAAEGYKNNPRKVFLEFLDKKAGEAKPLQMALAGGEKETRGESGFIQPTLAAQFLSVSEGPVASNKSPGKKAQQDVFGNTGAELPYLFGCIPLGDLLPESLSTLPRLIQRAIGEIDRLDEVLSDLTTIAEVPAAAKQRAAALREKLEKLPSFGSIEAAQPTMKAAAADIDSLAEQARKALLAPQGQGSGDRRRIEEALRRITELKNAGPEEFLRRAFLGARDLLEEKELRYTWETKLISKTGGLVELIFDDDRSNLKITSVVALGGGKANQSSVECVLRDFTLKLIGIKIPFKQLRFTSGLGMKPDVSADLDGVQFVDELAWIARLAALVPADAFSDPPAITVDASGIKAELSLGLPDLAIGIMCLANIRVSAGVRVPFISSDSIAVWFAFCSSEEPFCLTIMAIGGGGFFKITMSPAPGAGGENNSWIIEAGFECGAQLEINLAEIAKGCVYAFFGIYFRVSDDAAKIEGYFRFGGELSVLAVASISLEVYLGLAYEKPKVTGTAKVSIEISLFMFEFSTSVTVRRKLAGSGGDPSLLEGMKDGTENGVGRSPWREYWGAFAAV